MFNDKACAKPCEGNRRMAGDCRTFQRVELFLSVKVRASVILRPGLHAKACAMPSEGKEAKVYKGQ